MKIQRENLLVVLKRVSPLTKARTTIPELGMVQIGAMNGAFHAQSTDLDSYCDAVCNCKGNLNPVCVSPGPLIAVCSYGPDKVELVQDGPRLLVKGQNTAKLSTLSPEYFPVWPKDTKELGVNADDLREAIQAVMWAGDVQSPFAEIYRKSVWAGMDTAKHSLQAVCMDGKRFAWFKRKAVVPNAQLRFMCVQAPILCDVLSGSEPKVKVSEAFIEARTIDGSCAIKQTEPFKLPLEAMESEMSKAVPVGTIHKEQVLTELATIRSVAVDPFPHTQATFYKDEMTLDYVGKINEFRSVVTLGPAHTAPIPTCAPNGPLSITFDANLLHHVIKNTPGENISCKVGDRMLVFESGDVTTALALITPTP